MQGIAKGTLALCLLGCLWGGLVGGGIVGSGIVDGGVVASARADAAPAAAKSQQSANDFVASLHRRNGDVALPNGIATLHLGQAFYYLSPEDAERVLHEAWGNPAGSKTLGMIFPADKTPLDESTWGVTLSYAEDGHVNDDDAKSVDYAALLATMKKEVAEDSVQQVKDGDEAIELIGWAAQPFYDATTHTVHWAKELKFGNSQNHTLNYAVRTLGRKGVLEMNFVAGMDQLADIQHSVDQVLKIPEYKSGSRYADFNPSIDKVAAYGIGALVAGTIAAKTGMLAAGLLLVKKLWFIGLAGAAAATRWFRNRSKNTA